MAELPRRVDLRLTIPSSAPYRAIALDLAVKFAELAGATEPSALSRSVAAALTPAAGDDRPLAVHLSAVDGRVTVSASQD